MSRDINLSLQKQLEALDSLASDLAAIDAAAAKIAAEDAKKKPLKAKKKALGAVPTTGPGYDTSGAMFIGTVSAPSVTIGQSRALTIDSTTTPPTVLINGTSPNSIFIPVGFSLSPYYATYTTSPIAPSVFAAGSVLIASRRCMLSSGTSPMNPALIVETTNTTLPFPAAFNTITACGPPVAVTSAVATGGLATVSNVGSVYTITKVGIGLGTLVTFTMAAATCAVLLAAVTNSVGGQLHLNTGPTISNVVVPNFGYPSAASNLVSIAGTSTFVITAVGGVWLDGDVSTVTIVGTANLTTGMTLLPTDTITRVS